MRAAAKERDEAQAEVLSLRKERLLERLFLDADGRAEAAYFNPNPIKVAWCKISNEGAVLKVKAELRDVNYPGCLYALSYVPATDRWVGTYFQAQQQQTYDVEFARESAR